MSKDQPTWPPAATAACVVLSVVSIAPFLVLPLFVQAVARDLRYGDAQIGIFSSVVGAGSMLSAIAAVLWIRKVAWRPAALASLALVAASQAACLVLNDAAAWFLGLQCLAGFAGGTLYSLALTALSDGPQAERGFSFSVAAQVAFQVAGLAGGPVLLTHAGLAGLLVAMVVLALLGIPAAAGLPDSHHRAIVAPPLRHLFRRRMALALGGCCLFYCNIGVYWTYIERIGNAAGHAPQDVANCLALGVALGLPAALVGAWLGNRAGRTAPLAASALLVVAAAALALGRPGLGQLAASVLAFNLAWNLALPYQYAAVNALDQSRRGVAVTPAFSAAGIAAGPAIAAAVVAPGDYAAVLGLTAAAALASALCFWRSLAPGS
jgi:predicted MFS family arabinose efflux permease